MNRLVLILFAASVLSHDVRAEAVNCPTEPGPVRRLWLALSGKEVPLPESRNDLLDSYFDRIGKSSFLENDKSIVQEARDGTKRVFRDIVDRNEAPKALGFEIVANGEFTLYSGKAAKKFKKIPIEEQLGKAGFQLVIGTPFFDRVDANGTRVLVATEHGRLRRILKEYAQKPNRQTTAPPAPTDATLPNALAHEAYGFHPDPLGSGGFVYHAKVTGDKKAAPYAFESGYFEPKYSVSSKFLNKYGYRYDFQRGAYEIPDVDVLNARIQSARAANEPDAPIMSFVRSASDQELGDVEFARHFIEGRLPISQKGKLFYHDSVSHAPGYLLFTERVRPLIVGFQAELQILVRIFDRITPGGWQHSPAFVESVLREIKRRNEAIDAVSVYLSDAVLPAKDKRRRHLDIVSALSRLNPSVEAAAASVRNHLSDFSLQYYDRFPENNQRVIGKKMLLKQKRMIERILHDAKDNSLSFNEIDGIARAIGEDFDKRN